MELGLSLGDASKPFGFVEKSRNRRVSGLSAKDLGFCAGLSIGSTAFAGEKDAGDAEEEEEENENREGNQFYREEDEARLVSDDGPVQLDLLPHTPVPRNLPSSIHAFHLPASEDGSSEAGSSARGLDVNRIPSTEADDGDASPTYNAAMSFSMYMGRGDGAGNEMGEADRTSRASDDDDNGSGRKKLRLSKEQSAFLEESFKEHNTLNPKQKLALANHLNLRPRQVEVWFQNRRARTKLKQTEVDCEYLKRCCETLTTENRRLQKELQELRALKSSNSFYMQLPATTLTMCPSCERVAPSSTSATTAAAASKTHTEPVKAASGLSFSRPRSYPFGPHHSTAS